MKKILERVPQAYKPYIELGRFDRPIGSLLVFWPCSWSAVLASTTGIPNLGWLGVAASASFMMRAAGCTANDWWDKEIDKQVARTKERPIASGKVSNLGALGFLAFNLSPVPVVLALIGDTGKYLMLYSMPLLGLYPLAKRFIHWPQAVLGLAMNYGCVINYVFLTNRLDLHIIAPLYAGAWCWTMIYDTVYAFQDIKDDKKVGVGSTAVRWESGYKKYLAGLTAGCAVSWGVTGYMAGLGTAYYACLIPVIGHITHQWATVDVKDPSDCWKKFKSNNWVGFAVFLSLIVGKKLKD